MCFDFVYGIRFDTREKTNREPQIRDLLSDSLRSQTFGLFTDSGL